MLYKNNKNDENIITFVRDTLQKHFEDSFEELEFNEEGESSKSRLWFNLKLFEENIEGIEIFRFHHRIFINGKRVGIVREYNYINNFYIWVDDNSLIFTVMRNEGDSTIDRRISVYNTAFVRSKEGVLVFSFSDASFYSDYVYTNSPVLIKNGEVTELEDFRPINIYSNFVGEDNTYYSTPLSFISKNKGVLHTNAQAIASENLSQEITSQAFLTSPYSYLNVMESNYIYIPMPILFGSFKGEE